MPFSLLNLRALRSHSRGIALFALLAVCLRLATMAALDMGNQRLTPVADNATFATLQICTVAGMSAIDVEDEPLPARHAATSTHCPFCITPANASLPVIAFAFPPPEAAEGVFLPATAAGFQPAAPDLRHAPKHAPPVSFA